MSDDNLSYGQASQRTLDGDELDIEPRECEYYDGCRADAEFVLETLVYGEGTVEVVACSGCKDEFLEVADEDKVRELTIKEKMNA